MPAILDAIKTEHTKHAFRVARLRPSQKLPRRKTAHRRMPMLVDAGGWLELGCHQGPQIPRHEWEELTYITYPTDPFTYFAPITSATGAMELSAFGKYGKCDLDGHWTDNAQLCPTIVAWLQSIGARFGRVQLLRMKPNTLKQCRWGLHLDNNNAGNPESNGWAVRLWLELTHDSSSRLVVRQEEFDRQSEVQIPLPRYKQVVVDSQALYHGGYHSGNQPRYALITTVESGRALERWIHTQRPDLAPAS